MREILFRGRKCANLEWVYGCYYKQTEFYGDEWECHIIITSSEDLSFDQALEFSIVSEKTVGQYTGLTDKNGKKVFEGDIVKDGYSRIVGVVTFGTGTFDSGIYRYNGWHIKERDGNVDHNELFYYGEYDDYEVIGNIHDNPELLEVEENG